MSTMSAPRGSGRPRPRRSQRARVRLRAAPRRQPPARHRARRARAPSATPGAPSAPSSTRPGATDVILRYEEGGGFVMPAWTAAQAPAFTLYGDGTIIFRNPNQDAARRPVGSVMPFHPFRTAKMNEEQIQDAARIRARRRRPRRGPAGVPEHDWSRTPRRRSSRSTPAAEQDGLGLRARARDRRTMPDLPRPQDASRSCATASSTSTRAASITTDVYAPERYRGDPARGPARRPRPEGLAVAGHQDRRVRQRTATRTRSSCRPAS